VGRADTPFRKASELFPDGVEILSKVERGKLYPGGKVRRKLAAAMDLTPMDLWWIGPDAEYRQENTSNGYRGPGREARRTEHREAS